VLLDELNIVLRYDYLRSPRKWSTLLRARSRSELHVVVTGRNAKDELIEAADLVTEMTMVKHPFRSGVKAQQGSSSTQVVVQGRVVGNAWARDYQAMKPSLLPCVLKSFAHIAEGADLVLVEGAGSASEVNLRQGDIANMGFAEAADVPVALIGDIDRGGVIASLVGTWALLSPSERARTGGFVINKLRGDARLFDDGLRIVAERTGLRPLGLVPWFADARLLPAEDSLALDARETSSSRPIKVVAPRLPAIANFDDLDPLRAEPDVAVEIVPAGRALPGDADLVVLPGSKATRSDLARLRAEGWDIDLAAHVRRGGWVVGLCGGFQMLGRRVADPQGMEGPPGSDEGLGLLDVETEFGREKTVVQTEGEDVASGLGVAGYEIHVGRTSGPGLSAPMLRLRGAPDGAVAGRVMGCYLHGLFTADAFRAAFLARLKRRAPSGVAYEAGVDAALDRLADHIEAALDLDRLLELARAR
jgi:adenosylcobyric acid synthase